MDEKEEISFQEKTKIKELEKRIRSIRTRYRLAILSLIFLFALWYIILEFIGIKAKVLLIYWGCILGLATCSFIALTALFYIFKYFKLLFIPEPDAPMFSKEELEEDYYSSRKLAACSDCMVVYDARRLKCPECGKETMRKGKNSTETPNEEEE